MYNVSTLDLAGTTAERKYKMAKSGQSLIPLKVPSASHAEKRVALRLAFVFCIEEIRYPSKTPVRRAFAKLAR